jgi:hypothetical protein
MALATAALAVAACSSGSSSSPGGGGGSSGAAGSNAFVLTVRSAVSRNVDVVFVIDDAGSSGAAQRGLVSAFAEYQRVLASLPGGLPNVHIGVVSTNMGAGRTNDIESCKGDGDTGVFQSRPRGPTCATAGLNPGQNFLINVNGQANYTGTLADAFTCIAMLGQDGCAFTHPLEAALRALGADGARAPAENTNFLRDDAFLQVVVLSVEDDCSAPPNSDLFDVNDALGPRTTYRCSRFGHLCKGKQPPALPASAVDLGTCVSAEDGRLIRVQDVARALKNLKVDQTKVAVAAIGGPTTPYVVNVQPASSTDPTPTPYLEASCSIPTPDGGGVAIGEPGVRLKQWVDAFGSQGEFQTICNNDFTPAMTAIANQVGRLIGQACLPGSISASACKAVDQSVDSTGTTVEKPLRACRDIGDAGPCWSTENKTSQCPNDQSVVFRRPAPADIVATTLTCTR